MRPASVVVVGGGIGGFTVASALRDLGFTGRLALIDPGGLPYDRPPLSKAYLAGQSDAAALAFAGPAWFAERSVGLIAERAVALDAAGAVELSGGRVLEADAIVLATGGRARRLGVPGGEDPGLHYLRTRPQADRLRAALVPGSRLAVVGAGLIGAEVASVASGLGVRVTLIDPLPIALVPTLGQTIAAALAAQHAAQGVRLVVGAVAGLARERASWRLEVAGSESVVADHVLVAAGMVPATGLAERAGLATDRGVLVDAAQRTSAPGVWAIGDVARVVAGGVPQPRHEHWESAVASGRRAAASILEAEPPRPTAPWFWTERYGTFAEGAGAMASGLGVLRKRDGHPVADFRLADDGRMLGAAGLDAGSAIVAARRIIDRGLVVDPTALADASVDLRRLAR